MNRFAAALSVHPVPAFAAGELAGELLDQLDGDRPDLLVVFASPHHVGAFDDVVATLDRLLEPAATVGGTAAAIAGGPREVEAQPAISVFAATWPEGRATSFALDFEETPDGATITGWPDPLDDAPDEPATVLLFADPFSFPVDGVLGRLRAERPALTVAGGLASAATGPGGNRLVGAGAVRRAGAVGALLQGDVPVRTVVSQGCRPIGEPFTVTAAERNLVHGLGGQPPLDRFRAITEALTDAERALVRAGLTVGLMVGEDGDFTRADHLIRNVLGADKATGTIAVGGEVEVGQVLQFHVRDPLGADDDLRARLAYEEARGALLFTCTARGQAFFGRPDHDTGVLEELLGPVPLAGAFCAAEVGPVAGRAHLHTYTASAALFT